MDIEKLKQKILDLAIRGKLVPQNPNDETVQELIEKIRKEKELLISQGKIKRDKNESYIYKGSDNCYYRKIKDLIIPISTTSKEIKSKDVSNTGLYPVISQSKNYIDGYSNFDEKIIKTLPVILFGDHTKVVKFIDVPFIPGADGTKLFNSKCYSKYLYYLIMYASNKIENRGYGRHYALLKEFEVPYFEDINEQIYISIYLDYIFGKCYQVQEQKASIIKLIDRIKYKILDYYFGENSCYKSYYENKYKLGEILKYIQPGPYIVNSTKYNENYNTPVLTPGKSFILGYTNETYGIYKVKNKVIIFDDFTTASRLIDFDFKVKSSAMKILKIEDDNLFDIDYMYYRLQMIKIISDTHKRFWISEYAPILLEIHTIDEQKKIVQAINKAYSILNYMSNSI